MLIKRFVFNDVGVNTYVIVNKQTNEAIVIDPGMYTDDERLIFDDFVSDYKLQISLVLLTHGHFDHWFGADFLRSKGARVLMHRMDLPIIEQSVAIAEEYGFEIKQIPQIDGYLNDNKSIKLGDINIDVIHTPGHSPGHVCLRLEKEKVIFTGDLIFKNTIGRTDIPGGDYDVISKSIKDKILALKEDYTLLPGHGSETTLADELLNNPFILNIVSRAQ